VAPWPTPLAQGKEIIVCTIQTFPFALEAVRGQAATQGKRFAVIADEAHSSQMGETAAGPSLIWRLMKDSDALC
jgi:type I site-specific restriction-modification system R (restriction) subunit